MSFRRGRVNLASLNYFKNPIFLDAKNHIFTLPQLLKNVRITFLNDFESSSGSCDAIFVVLRDTTSATREVNSTFTIV